jgi:hypothetical protein
MNTEHMEYTERKHAPIHAASVDTSDPRAPRRNFAKDMLSSGRRLRQRMAVGVGLCVGLAALVIAFE